MLQRSPTWVVSLPTTTSIANFLRRVLPARWAVRDHALEERHAAADPVPRTRTLPSRSRRSCSIGCGRSWAGLRRRDALHARATTRGTSACAWCRTAICFESIRSGKAEIVTDRIERFTETGIALESGKELAADIIVTATGLKLVMQGEMQFSRRRRAVDFAKTWTYKGMMYSDVPNLITTFGTSTRPGRCAPTSPPSTPAGCSAHMDERGARQVTPRLRDADRDMPPRPWIDDFSSGYMQRSMHRFPSRATASRGSTRRTMRATRR
jgi:cation diffusion facilitator CzcD-associated flavoprotein CzcO